jgi:TetR/AcrR family transcriptional repressor of lmrAB and yxaGH operons
MAVRGVTRAHLVATGRKLFARQGYHSTGINQVLDQAEVPRGSLYFHFPRGKEQLAAEAVGSSAEEMDAVLDTLIARAPDPALAMQAVAGLLADRLEASEFLDGCPIATVAMDVGPDDTLVRDACCAGYSRWLTTIGRHLTRFGVRAEAAHDLALFALSSLEGALLLARTQRDAGIVRAVGDRIAAAIVSEID